MTITIDHAVEGDVAALVALLSLLFSIETDFMPDPIIQRRGLELLLAHPSHGQAFVARHVTAGLVGMASAQLVVSTAVGACSAWIEDVVIDPAFRGQGVGRALLDKARDWAKAKGATRIQLLADADNQPALDFYRHLGWQPTRLGAWKQALS
jgi:GNAT superfamily N-acetyltransferase